ncbi:hypothetical protein FPZ43_05870 [Mucilaginibacter pallidiroseus]|uniref:Uncharacterized protein n=1 Tax=Mucilaginibacter pallidiroseus TaxID=2599295 RepID=A0A563UGI6_9SPHI|nr:hypothetical protein [Mucilaginibacter pallidiroseus]TWR30467.1 hypothetical protein FPZ43_05870 [Mucilaginibacter pallidiroseus]
MNAKEHLVIEDDDINSFTEKLDEASEDGYKVVASNSFHFKHDNRGQAIYETLYYALLAKSLKDV